VWLKRGGKLDLPACKCAPEISKDIKDSITLVKAAETVQASAANSRQVGGMHYQAHIQHWDYVLANNIPYLEAQIIRYLTRWRKKDGFKDLKKAYHFLQKLAESEGCSLEEAANNISETSAEQADSRYTNQEGTRS
jgi:hypothetical protein